VRLIDVHRSDVMLPGSLQCPQLYNQMLVDIVRATFYIKLVTWLLYEGLSEKFVVWHS